MLNLYRGFFGKLLHQAEGFRCQCSGVSQTAGLKAAGLINKRKLRNVEHRTSNIEHRIKEFYRFKSRLQTAPTRTLNEET